MQVAIYAGVSTLDQRQEGAIASQIQLLKQHIQQQSWSLLPEHEFLDEGDICYPCPRPFRFSSWLRVSCTRESNQ
jgi:hypothetical protein